MDNNELQKLHFEVQDGIPVVSSRDVAEHFGKTHKNVLRAIYGYDQNDKHYPGIIDEIRSAQNRANLYFLDSSYIDSFNRQQKQCFMTRDGFTLLAMGFTGQKATEWKIKYIEGFNAMEKQLRELGGRPHTEIEIVQKSLEIIKKQGESISELQVGYGELKEGYDQLRKEVDVIGAYHNSGQYVKLRSICSSRVMSLLSNEIYRILWSPYFYKAIHTSLAYRFGVSSTKLINTGDIEEAKEFVSRWKPSDKYIKEKTAELIKKKEAGTLKENRAMALMIWLQDTENGTKNPF